jgi:guanine deaminase
MSTGGYSIVRGGLLLDVPGRTTRPADILVEGDTIREIGPPGMDGPAEAAVVDAAGKLVMPGLVNAHTHGHGALGKGLGDKWSLEHLLNHAPWTSSGFTLEDKRLAAQINAVELVLKGCTAAYDMYFEFPRPSLEGLEAAGSGYADIGVRVVLAPMMADANLFRAIPGLMDAIPESVRPHVERLRATPYEESVAACREILHGWPFDRALVAPALGPTIPHHCSDPFVAACRDLAAEYEVGVQMHLAESKVQAVTGIKRYGKSLARHLDDLGLIGPRFTGAHCVWLDQDDMKLMADKGAAIAHNPGSNLRLGSGVAPARAMLESGLTVGIGTDGSASSDNQNMFEAMRFAAFVSRIVDRRTDDWLGTWEVLAMATEGGARVLGMSDAIGRLAPGYKADIVFLDLANVNFLPLNDAANQIVNCEDSSAVDSVMIGGRMVLAGRRFTGFDYDGLRVRAQAACERILTGNAEIRVRMEAVEEFVALHCLGMMGEPYHVHRRIDGGAA